MILITTEIRENITDLISEMNSLMAVKCNSEIWASDGDNLQQDLSWIYLDRNEATFMVIKFLQNHWPTHIACKVGFQTLEIVF